MAQAVDRSTTSHIDPRLAAMFAKSTFDQSAEPPTMSDDNDAALLELGREATQLEAWFDAQENCVPPRPDDDPEYDRKLERHGELLERIIAMPARTEEGRSVKVDRILHWCKGFDLEMMDADGQLGLSLAQDLARHA